MVNNIFELYMEIFKDKNHLINFARPMPPSDLRDKLETIIVNFEKLSNNIECILLRIETNSNESISYPDAINEFHEKIKHNDREYGDVSKRGLSIYEEKKWLSYWENDNWHGYLTRIIERIKNILDDYKDISYNLTNKNKRDFYISHQELKHTLTLLEDYCHNDKHTHDRLIKKWNYEN